MYISDGIGYTYYIVIRHSPELQKPLSGIVPERGFYLLYYINLPHVLVVHIPKFLPKYLIM